MRLGVDMRCLVGGTKTEDGRPGPDTSPEPRLVLNLERIEVPDGPGISVSSPRPGTPDSSDRHSFGKHRTIRNVPLTDPGLLPLYSTGGVVTVQGD